MAASTSIPLCYQGGRKAAHAGGDPHGPSRHRPPGLDLLVARAGDRLNEPIRSAWGSASNVAARRKETFSRVRGRRSFARKRPSPGFCGRRRGQSLAGGHCRRGFGQGTAAIRRSQAGTASSRPRRRGSGPVDSGRRVRPGGGDDPALHRRLGRGGGATSASASSSKGRPGEFGRCTPVARPKKEAGRRDPGSPTHIRPTLPS